MNTADGKKTIHKGCEPEYARESCDRPLTDTDQSVELRGEDRLYPDSMDVFTSHEVRYIKFPFR